MTEISKKDWDKIEKNFSRYAKIIGEDFKSQIRPIAEVQQEHSKILGEHSKILGEHSKILGEQSRTLEKHGKTTEEHTRKLNAILEMVAQNTVDINIIKDDISIIKNNLKQKVNLDEFVALEKRVIILENKLRRV